ncbi:MAG: ATP-binding cassette domain-containing protein [Polyangia bacterium]|jgi:ABC-type polysaccharide/polyol phosphate transport system ATPase subunit|nr:ATP-binding cassette domain-containing protein [Polyangia bacterium]
MARVVIRNLGIRFNLDAQRDLSIRNRILNIIRPDPQAEFWAIRHVDLELSPGDILGITGPNGSGKSTLLRAITGIYRADEGELLIEGRVSLLSIGAGFIKDLNGIENIYLNGAIFGFSEAQIAALVPKIAEFADIGDFMRQPIRMYSSGMLSRLGFAVAINLDPDILLIDEVLAVGDAAFKQKCKDAIGELLSRKDRIVVIVSHEPAILDNLCNRRIELLHPKFRDEDGRTTSHPTPDQR